MYKESEVRVDRQEIPYPRYPDWTLLDNGSRLNPVPPETRQRIAVNKQTHRIRFEDETENGVTVVIEPKD